MTAWNANYTNTFIVTIININSRQLSLLPTAGWWYNAYQL